MACAYKHPFKKASASKIGLKLDCGISQGENMEDHRMFLLKNDHQRKELPHYWVIRQKEWLGMLVGKFLSWGLVENRSTVKVDKISMQSEFEKALEGSNDLDKEILKLGDQNKMACEDLILSINLLSWSSNKEKWSVGQFVRSHIEKMHAWIQLSMINFN